MTTRNYLLSLVLGAALGFAINIGCAYAGIGATYPEIGCTDNGDCYAFLCTVVTNTREHCVKVPTPRARPVIPCDTDSDCKAKNGGNGDPINAQCFDPQDDATFGENGILCRDGEDY